MLAMYVMHSCFQRLTVKCRAFSGSKQAVDTRHASALNMKLIQFHRISFIFRADACSVSTASVDQTTLTVCASDSCALSDKLTLWPAWMKEAQYAVQVDNQVALQIAPL